MERTDWRELHVNYHSRSLHVLDMRINLLLTVELIVVVSAKVMKLISVGKRRSALEAMPYSLPSGISTLRDLITAVVEKEVAAYNSKETDAMLLPYLTQQQVDDQSMNGKVHFGRIYSDKKADTAHAVETAVQGFEDGFFRITINDAETKDLSAPIALSDGDTLTFIRLTFLSGSIF